LSVAAELTLKQLM